MKIIHTADLHLDSKLTTNLDKEKAKHRKYELLYTFERLIDYAEKEKVKVIIIAGDFFDTKNSTKRSMGFIVQKMKWAANIDFLYVPGNHDENSFIDYIKDKELTNFKVFNDKWSSFTYGDVVISGIINNVATHAYLYSSLNLDPSKKNIVVMHGELNNYGKNDESINLNKLMNKNIDYLALGHIHYYNTGRIDARGVYAYPGCLEGRGFDEDGEKGFILLDINEKVNFQFVPFARRTLRVIELDITSFTSWNEIYQKVIDLTSSISKNDMIKIVLTGTYTLELDKDINLLTKRINNNFYFGKVEDKSKLHLDPKTYVADKSLKGEFIRTVLNSKLDDNMKNDIIVLGVDALEKEEL